MKVTAATHPQLYRAFTLILLDSGGINRLEPQPPAYDVPGGGLLLVRAAERGLATLSEEDFETLCNGEFEAAARIAARSSDLTAAHELLDWFFDHDGGR